MRRLRFAVMFLLFSCSQDRAAMAQSLTPLADGATGIQLSLPPELVASQRQTKWGTNWQHAGNTLNIDSLNFGTRSIAELHTTLRSVRGRRITNVSSAHSRLVLEGADSDGTWFYIAVEQRNGQSRGISIVYSTRTYEPLVRSIAASFVPFPETQLAQRSPLPSAQPQSADGASQQVAELSRELERVKEQLKEQEIERQRQRDIEAIRKQERERLEKEFSMRDQERVATMKAERERELREARAFTEERQRARDREADLEKKIAEVQKAFKIQQSEAPKSGQTSGKRVAFVVGINKYEKLQQGQQLKTAVNDAHMIAATLGKLGFQVTNVATDISRSTFNREWQRFLNSIARGSVAAFFYAGHGVQIDGQNYLLPGDAPPADFGQAEFLVNEAISFNVLLDQMARQAPSLSLIVLDACRDNPYADARRSGAGQRGLAAIDSKVTGTFIMYSAAAGQSALDRLPEEQGDVENSVYTRALVPLLLQEGLNINQVAIRVRSEVARLAARASNHQQHPAYYDGLQEGTFCLAGGCSDAKSAGK